MIKCLLKLFIGFLSCCSLVMLVFAYVCLHMPGVSPQTSQQVLSESEAKLADNLRQHIVHLSEEIGERHYLARYSLAKTADYIRQQFQRYNLQVETIAYGDERTYEIVYVELTGSNADAAKIIIGAHYDTVPITLGADDNASGVAALLELANLLQAEVIGRNILLVAFPNEESPFYNTHLMGSRVFADSIAEQRIIGMISLEMLGYYSFEPGSQRYPWPVSWFYPDVASFIAFVGDLASRDWLRRSIQAFRLQSTVASEGLVAPVSVIPDVGRSDQISFWRHDIPAFMITDTANFRSPYYHFAGDVVETLDLTTMSRVVIGLKNMLISLANDKTL